MNIFLIKFEIKMPNENLIQIQRGLQQLMENVHRLIDDSIGDGASQAKKISKEGAAMFENVLEKCASIKDECMDSSRNMLCKAENCVQHKPILSLGLAALVGGIIGAVISRRSHQ
jgi:ElaB/YqjD/DUF883 family membrane-anchored ribosome-binding protein